MCQISTLLYEYPKKHELSVEWIADTIGVNSSTLHRYLNPHDNLSFPLRLLIPFCTACNKDYSAIDHIEERVGRIAVKNFSSNEKPEVTASTVADLAQQQGKALSVFINALSDNKLTDQEKKQLRKEYNALAKQIHGILEGLN